MDSPTSAVVVAGIVGATAVLKPFFEKITGAAGDVVAGRINDHFGAKRVINLAKVVTLAQAKAREEGLDPSKIPLKVIHPLLENASLEEDENLQEMWGTLLAKAANTTETFTSPAFVEVLRQLRPNEAKFFNNIYLDVMRRGIDFDERLRTPSEEHPTDNIGITQTMYEEKYAGEMPPHEVSFSLSNLSRLGLLSEPHVGRLHFAMTAFGLVFGSTVCDWEKVTSEIPASMPPQ